MGFGENLGKWQNYAHYLLLTIGLTIVFHFMEIHAFHTDNFLPNWNFVILFVALFIVDTIVHAIFYALPKDYGQWKD